MPLPPPSEDTKIVVTGASSGIGEAIARELAARGYGLTLVARRRDVIAALAEELGADHLAADLTKTRDRARVATAAKAATGLVNNAGAAAFGDVIGHDPAEESAMVALNVVALHALTVAAAREMARRGRGAVLNAGSTTAFAPFPGNATYAATKAFVQSFSEALHEELARSGVSCTTAVYGPVRSGMWGRAGSRREGTGGDLVWQDPEDAARAAVDAMIDGRRTVTPGLTNKLTTLGGRLAPRTALLPATRALNRLMNGTVRPR